MCFFRLSDLPEDKPRNVIFVDAGHAGVQVSACSFTKGKLVMKAASYRRGCGGKYFDSVIVNYFAQEFLKKYKINAMENHRARLRLGNEVEKLKKQLSANANKLPLNIECFMNDVDVSSGGVTNYNSVFLRKNLKPRMPDCILQGVHSFQYGSVIGLSKHSQKRFTGHVNYDKCSEKDSVW